MRHKETGKKKESSLTRPNRSRAKKKTAKGHQAYQTGNVRTGILAENFVMDELSLYYPTREVANPVHPETGALLWDGGIPDGSFLFTDESAKSNKDKYREIPYEVKSIQQYHYEESESDPDKRNTILGRIQFSRKALENLQRSDGLIFIQLRLGRTDYDPVKGAMIRNLDSEAWRYYVISPEMVLRNVAGEKGDELKVEYHQLFPDPGWLKGSKGGGKVASITETRAIPVGEGQIDEREVEDYMTAKGVRGISVDPLERKAWQAESFVSKIQARLIPDKAIINNTESMVAAVEYDSVKREGGNLNNYRNFSSPYGKQKAEEYFAAEKRIKNLEAKLKPAKLKATESRKKVIKAIEAEAKAERE
jgi:hypothetical protein